MIQMAWWWCDLILVQAKMPRGFSRFSISLALASDKMSCGGWLQGSCLEGIQSFKRALKKRKGMQAESLEMYSSAC